MTREGLVKATELIENLETINKILEHFENNQKNGDPVCKIEITIKLDRDDGYFFKKINSSRADLYNFLRNQRYDIEKRLKRLGIVL